MLMKDRVALVTGSGRGIGAATALELARNGADIVINDLDETNAHQVMDEIKKLGRKTLFCKHDVSDYSAAQDLAGEVHKHFGRIDILVNNAGILRDALLLKMTEANWDDVIRVNLKGPFNVGQACAKYMSKAKYGKIVNLASVAWLGNVGQTNYSAAKAGLVGMTRTWAMELSRFGINVNAVAPGFIDTAMTQQVPTEIKEKFVARIPLRRMGNVEDIAHLITFLASDHSSYITGECILIDGGLSAGISPA
jgi:3-oxoacyl-[acyl-carrier protein] reductase